MSHVLILPSADTSKLPPPLANTCVFLLLTKKTNRPSHSGRSSTCPDSQEGHRLEMLEVPHLVLLGENWCHGPWALFIYKYIIYTLSSFIFHVNVGFNFLNRTIISNQFEIFGS